MCRHMNGLTSYHHNVGGGARSAPRPGSVQNYIMMLLLVDVIVMLLCKLLLLCYCYVIIIVMLLCYCYVYDYIQGLFKITI